MWGNHHELSCPDEYSLEGVINFKEMNLPELRKNEGNYSYKTTISKQIFRREIPRQQLFCIVVVISQSVQNFQMESPTHSVRLEV